MPKLSFEVQTASDQAASSADPLVNPKRLLVFGNSGTGKTMAACRATADLDADLDAVWDGTATLKGDAHVFALLLEQNGVDAALAANPQLKYVVSDSMDTTREVLSAARQGVLQKQYGVTRLVIDGLTELQMQLLDAMYPQGAPRDLDWMAWNDATRRMLRGIRALPMDVYVTALAQAKAFAENQPEKVTPAMQGRKAPAEAMQYFDAVAYLSKGSRVVDGVTKIEHEARFTLPGRYQVKPCRQLRGTVRPVMSAWADVLRGTIPPAAVQMQDPPGAGKSGGR